MKTEYLIIYAACYHLQKPKNTERSLCTRGKSENQYWTLVHFGFRGGAAVKAGMIL